MSTGSSQDTGQTPIRGFVVRITDPPVVEIDTEASAAYVRFLSTAVARTEPYASKSGFVMIDFDDDGNVVGLEFVGQQEFSIQELVKQIPVEASPEILARTRYVAADLQAA